MIDHLVMATDDLERTVAHVRDTWGITPTPGGAHVGHGTRNELVQLGGGAYLELIGPDLEQVDHVGARPFGVDGGTGDRLVAWCARPDTDLATTGIAALSVGHDIGPVMAMSRRRPDGVVLAWQLTLPPVADPSTGPAVLPFLIDWLHSEHPTATLPQPVELLELQLLTPQGERTRAVLDTIGRDARISIGAAPDDRGQLVARVRTPAGTLTLTGEIP